MSEQNKALARRFYDEIFNRKNIDAIDEMCAPDFVDHTQAPGQGPGRQGLKEIFGVYSKAFPDLQMNVEQLIAEGDLVAAMIAGTGTHKGEFMGAAPTGKTITSRGIDMIRFRNGKAVEAWHYGDEMMMFMEIGVKPSAPSA